MGIFSNYSGLPNIVTSPNFLNSSPVFFCSAVWELWFAAEGLFV